MRLKVKNFAITFSLFLGLAGTQACPSLAQAEANGLMCQMLFAPGRVQTLRPEQQKSFATYLALSQHGRLWTVGSASEVLDLLADNDVPVFGERFEKIVAALHASGQPSNHELFYAETRKLLRESGVSNAMIEKGIEENRKGQRGTLRRLLGDLTFAETRMTYMGHAGAGTEFTADSLLGQYIRDTGAKTKLMPISDLVTKEIFPEAKLFVAVSAASFPSFQKYFSNRTVMSSFGHGTVFNGGSSYNVHGKKSALHALSNLTPLPMVILKPSEGERLNRYLEASVTPDYLMWNNALKQPWFLKNSVTGKPYVENGAYTCCTNHIGNMPIGDKVVPEYALPKTHEYAQRVEAGEPSAPRAVIVGSKLEEWDNAEHSALKNIWTTPGHEQFSSLLGQLERNVNGEFASPGYVIQTLMGDVSSERVPVVFIFTDDHTVEIPDQPTLNFERPT